MLKSLASKSVRFFSHFILKVLLLRYCNIVKRERERERERERQRQRQRKGEEADQARIIGLLLEISSQEKKGNDKWLDLL